MVNSSSNSSLYPQFEDCFMSRGSSFILMAWIVVYFLLIPVFVLVLYIGFQRWWKQRSVSAAVVTSHCDVFTFHMVAVEMIHIVGSCLYCRGILSKITSLTTVGESMSVMASFGQMFFHVLTCVVRYLAVVHPVTYQRLKQAGGVRIRNISIGCVWLLSVALMIEAHVHVLNSLHLSLFFVLLSVAFVSFCSFSFLCVLIRPGPGEVGRDRKQIDQSKLRALNTMMIILGALLFNFVGHLVICITYYFLIDDACVILMSALWFNLPSSLVLPLLFLHRAGKLPGCNQI